MIRFTVKEQGTHWVVYKQSSIFGWVYSSEAVFNGWNQTTRHYEEVIKYCLHETPEDAEALCKELNDWATGVKA